MTVIFTIAIVIELDLFSFSYQKIFIAKYRPKHISNTHIFMILILFQLAIKIVQRSRLEWIHISTPGTFCI